jgi:hypothetical protein
LVVFLKLRVAVLEDLKILAIGFDGFFGDRNCGNGVFLHRLIEFKEFCVYLELDKIIIGVIEKTLYLFEGQDVLFLVFK